MEPTNPNNTRVMKCEAPTHSFRLWAPNQFVRAWRARTRRHLHPPLCEFDPRVLVSHPDDDRFHSAGPQERFDVGLVAGEDLFLRLHEQRYVGVCNVT